MLLGLIGNPLSHSRSPQIFAELFRQAHLHDWEYRLFPLQSIGELEPLILQNPDLIGLNVTIPYKEKILPYIHELSPEAQFIGAVNTVLIKRKNTNILLTGTNTDAFGFEKALNRWSLPHNISALILGSGGASKAVQFVLKKKGMDFKIVSREAKKGHLTYNDIKEDTIHKNKLIINTTPLGMEPDRSSFPNIPYTALGPEHYCFDLVYKPEKTRFLQLCEAQGAAIENGMNMLQYQAEKAWQLFYNHAQQQ